MNLSDLDKLADHLCQSANRLRQVRDSFPEAWWQLVPPILRVPLDELFAAVEAYDRAIGLAREGGLLGQKGVD